MIRFKVGERLPQKQPNGQAPAFWGMGYNQARYYMTTCFAERVVPASHVSAKSGNPGASRTEIRLVQV